MLDDSLRNRLTKLLAAHPEEPDRRIRFIPPSWARHVGDRAALLTDDRYTHPSTWRAGHRWADMSDVRAACQDLDLADDEAVLHTFVLVMAWGAGTSLRGRIYANAARAIGNEAAANGHAAQTLRGAARLARGGDLVEAYRAAPCRVWARPSSPSGWPSPGEPPDVRGSR